MTAVQRPPAFVPFDENRAVTIYQRNLPHWRQDGCTYFVTFRLADSIPTNVRQEWEWEKQQWLKRHGIAYDGERRLWHTAFSRLPADERRRFEKHFNRRVQACLDRGMGMCRLKDSRCMALVRDELHRHDLAKYHLADYVIMPNHVHLLLTPIAPTKLEAALKAIKGSSAVACNQLCRQSGAFWQADSYDHIVRSLEQLHAYREYIAANPAMAGIEVPGDAIYRANWMDAWFAS